MILHIAPVIFILLLTACVPSGQYTASKAALEKTMPERATIPADGGCSVCHRIVAEGLTYRYYPVRISHRRHSEIGLQCVFCHRKAATSPHASDYLMPAGHGFAPGPFEKPTGDRNPCRACHLYYSDVGKRDKKIPAECKTCHDYKGDEPVMRRWHYITNLISNHGIHYKRGVPCLRCHPGFDSMENTTLNHFPKMDICTECHAPDSKTRPEAKNVTAGKIRDGEILFRENCAVCHGLEGKGDGPMVSYFRAGLTPRDLTDASHMSRRTDRQIFDVIMKGGPELTLSERMPSWEGLLKEEEAALLVKHIRRISGTGHLPE